MRSITFIILLALVSLNGMANPLGYQCTFLEEYELKNNGKLVRVSESQLEGENFSVDRKTGNAITPAHAIWPHSQSKITVLSAGNEDNSFVATYESEAKNNGVFLSSLRIEEFTKGVNKPFVVLANYFVYTGMCK